MGGGARGRLGFGVALAAIVLIGLLARLPMLTVAGSSYRLSESLCGEEVENVRISTGMLHKHTLNPHAFEYPSLFYYLSLLPESFASPAERSAWRADLLGVRSLSLCFSIVALLAVAALARRLAGDAAGLFAAALMALDRTQIEISTLAKPNAAQVGFVMLAFLVLAALAARPRLAAAVLAAVLLALAAATKWLGVLGLAGLALAPLLSQPGAEAPGLRRLVGSLRQGLGSGVAPWKLLLPVVAFVLVLGLCVPYALLSPREFGYGFAQVFTAQSVHQRAVPFWTPLAFLARSLGWAGLLAAAFGVLWGVRALARWDGSAHDRGVVLVLGWALVYGALLLFVFVRLPSYLDLWVPFLAVLAGCGWVGERGLVRGARARWLAIAVLLAAGWFANGAYAAAASRLAREFDTRIAAGNWLDRAAADSDAVLADLGTFVPDRLARVEWNAWGGPPRIFYDETQTWGWDPVWPAWVGGHRRLWFENAKWEPASRRLERRPRWVVVTDDWQAVRARAGHAGESADAGYDRALEDGSAGYALRASFAPESAPHSAWSVLGLEKRTRDAGPYYSGPMVKIYQRHD
jgi:hypothetical protein